MPEIFKNNELLEEPPEEKKAKIKYWDGFVKKHIPEMRVLFRGGKLWKKEGWRNVVEHSLPQGVAAEVLSDMIQLPESEKEKLIKNAICHDWDKHLEKKPDDFTDDDLKKAISFIEKVPVDKDLLAATKLDFIKGVIVANELGKDIPILQLLIFYIDGITSGSGDNIGEFITHEDRIAEVQMRYPELNQDHWDNEREANRIVQNKIYEILKEKGVLIENAEDIPLIIAENVEKKYGEYKK